MLRRMLLAATALAWGISPALAERITLKVAFQNETSVPAKGKVDDANEDDDDDRLLTDVPAQAHVTAPDAYFDINFLVTGTYYDVGLTLNDQRSCVARYVVYDNSCSRTALLSTGAVQCDSASNWSGKTCGIAIKITP